MPLCVPAAAARLWPGAGRPGALAAGLGRSSPWYLAAVFVLGVLFVFYVNVVAAGHVTTRVQGELQPIA
ncbi:hypothetical protein ACIQU4_21200 [Streptomyces sp. NPDC090741]|uniref:hypothetical protein n=1 Tax=Streptomyces sp. NPDC090741 TaxID=3365967 RepID=UPI00381CDF89